jgi:DNA polymerase-1
MKKVVIIDGLNMFLRSYIINPTMDPKGNLIGGSIGFLKSLQKVCNDFKPDEVIIAWDGQGGSQKRKEMNKDYKAGRKPVRFNRRMFELSDVEQEHNKAYQHVRLMEYLNELPIMQIVIDYVEADDIIAVLNGHPKYRDYHKYIISSDRDFFQLVGERTSLYRPIQKKLVTEDSLLAEHGIHPNNFALARAIAGDKSDNLNGVPRVGLKTVKSRFPFMVDEKVQSVETLAEHCRNVAKPISVHTKILGNLELIQKNYDIMQLYEPVISGTNQRSINYIVDNFEPEFNKLAFTKLLMEDGQITMNLDRLYLIFKKIIS